MIGAVRGIDPSRIPYDDTRRYIGASPRLSAADGHRIYEAMRGAALPRLDAALKRQGR